MLNQVIVVGRLTRDLEIKELVDGKSVGVLSLAVQREFKNYNGEYDVDFIKVYVWDSLAEALVNFCKKGVLVAAKARLQVRKTEIQETKINQLELIAMRVIYLAGVRNDILKEENSD